jgi:deazaflavin-dependent oxidoreductase (nitroreductase family)
MTASELMDALRERSEVQLTVTGRKSGRESSRPIWFVEEGNQLLLLPVSGTGSSWYKNLVETPAIRLAADGTELRAEAKPIEDQARVDQVLEEFRAKYGADQVEQYYPDQDAAVEVPLGSG